MSMPSTSSVAGGTPDTNRQLFSVKQERHDEAEILELAAKMMESHKAQMTKAAQQQQMQQQMRSVNVINSTGQTNILNYFPRKTSQQGSASLHAAGASTSIVPAAAVAATNGGTYNGKQQPNGESSSSASPDGEKKPCDEESQRGHFGWHTFNKNIYIPYILRSGEKYCAVRIVESKLLNKYLNYLHHDIYSCTCVRSYYITEAEGRLLNEINHKHSESHFGREMFTVKDLVVRLSDVSKFWTFLDVCYKKLLMGNNGQGQSEKCGFIRINKESVVPYTVRDGQKFVPLFYFEGETENLKLKADNLSGWDLSYLKFCCKVQGIRNELFASDKVAVISLTDIKSYFPPGTQFEDYWPNKVVDTQLLVQKSSTNSSVHWTRQPSAPPPKPSSSTQPKAAPVRKQATPASYGNTNVPQVNMQQRLPGQMGNTNTPVVSNVWSNLSNVPGLNLTPGQQEHVLRMAQVAQAQSQRGYPTTRSQVQNIMQRQPYNVNFPPGSAAAAALSAMTGLTSSSNQVPPPLIRGAQQAPTSHHMSAASLMHHHQQQQHNHQQQQLHQQQQQLHQRNQQMLNGRCNTSAQIMHGATSAASAAAQVAAMQQHQRQSSLDASRLSAIPEMVSHNGNVPYKMQKAQIDGCTVPCINMKAYTYTDLLMTLADLKDIFFPHMTLENCRKVLDVLNVELYKGNRSQLKVFQEYGHHGMENMALVLVQDIINFMPQLKYMVRSQTQEQPAHKRARIS
uniref:Putative transcription factor iia n=1 Tax=Nyssomyia neivai TaxID=330878 RepID=A0A1L8DFY7_9DIPT